MPGSLALPRPSFTQQSVVDKSNEKLDNLFPMGIIETYRERHGLTRKGFGALVGVGAEAVRLWETNKRKPSHEIATALEAKTGGELRRSDLRPDIWPDDTPMAVSDAPAE